MAFIVPFDVDPGARVRTLTIKHITTYRYRQPVAFGEHRMMLRPRDSHDQRLIDARLVISPQPKRIRRTQDAHGNHVDIAHFAGRAKELRFESTVRLAHSHADIHDAHVEPFARSCPFVYGADEMPDLIRFMKRQAIDPDGKVERWARTFLRSDRPTHTRVLLADLTDGIDQTFKHVRRDEKGVQAPLQTLALGSGSCRDFAVLMIEAVRSLGMAARFVSGYLHIRGGGDEGQAGRHRDGRNMQGGNTHAWAQVYLPGPGWIDCDPSSGIVGNRDLVRVAVVHDPRQAIPLHGTWTGFPSDYLGMDVAVAVTSEPVALEDATSGSRR
jgi:transglutaminase-like putative cysteine protease